MRRLQVENRSLKATNQALRDVEHEVNRLRHALAYRERSLFRLVPAEIVSRDSSTWWRTVTINRGEAGWHSSPTCRSLTDEGLVGQTTTVSANISVVLLVSDENCRVAASVEGTREQGIVTGERVPGVSRRARPEFSLEAGRAEAGSKSLHLRRRRSFSLGPASSEPCTAFKSRALDSQAKVAPAVDLAKLEDVFVVIGKKMRATRQLPDSAFRIPHLALR